MRDLLFASAGALAAAAILMTIDGVDSEVCSVVLLGAVVTLVVARGQPR